MRLFSAFSLISAFLAPLTASQTGKQQVTVYTWPLSDSKPHVFAEITYDSQSLSASTKKYHPLTPSSSGDLVRVGLYDSKTSDWVGVVTAGSQFESNRAKQLTIHIDQEGRPFYVGFATSTPSEEKPVKGKKTTTEEGLEIIVKPPVQGPQPHLNRPVVLNQDGKVDEKQPEKSFLQKCVSSLFIFIWLWY